MAMHNRLDRKPSAFFGPGETAALTEWELTMEIFVKRVLNTAKGRDKLARIVQYT